ncbi:MAG: methyl-accepting chemotaxis protein [Halanaerobacter sp.]
MSIIIYLLFILISILYFELGLIAHQGIRILFYIILSGTVIYFNHHAFNYLLKLTKKISQEEYNTKINPAKFKGKYKIMAEYIQSIKKKIINLNFEIKGSSSQVSSISEQLTLTVDESTAFAQELLAETEHMRSLNKDNQEIIDKLVTKVTEVRELSAESKDIIHDSLTDIMEVVNTINNIQSSTDQTATNVEELQVSSKEIKEIIDTVNDISQQTDLLALNAAIESARAISNKSGSDNSKARAGQGFAVVAEEIRELSDDSQKSVGQIKDLIKDIRSKVNDVTDMTEENVEVVATGVKKANQIESSLEKIEQMITEQFALIADIHDQVSNLDQIRDKTMTSVEEVYQSVNQQKNKIESIQNLGSRLNNSVDNLSQSVNNIELFDQETIQNEVTEKAAKTKDILEEELLNNQGFKSLDASLHQRLLDELIEKYNFIEAIWTNKADGQFIYSNPPAGLANAKVRDWFQSSINGEEFISNVYISSITHRPCATVSIPITNEGEVMGVIGADIKLKLQN